METCMSVVLPAYNEAKRIVPTLKDIAEYMSLHRNEIDEVIVVDDGSKDQTSERVLAFAGKMPELKLVVMEKNGGKWAAIRKGMAAAKNDAVLLMDADGSASVWNLERLGFTLDDVMAKKIPVWGSRFMKGARVEGKSALRVFVSQGYRVFAKTCYWWAKRRTDVDDMQCPFKIVFKSRLAGEMTQERFCGDIELACITDAEILSFPVHFVHKAGSTVRPQSVVGMFVETLQVAKRRRVRKKRSAT